MIWGFIYDPDIYVTPKYPCEMRSYNLGLTPPKYPFKMFFGLFHNLHPPSIPPPEGGLIED